MIIEKPAIEILDPAAKAILPENIGLEQVATGFIFTEGPVWCGDYFIFSDIPMNRIIRMDFTSKGPEVTTYRSPTGHSNGLTLDHSGRLIICQHSGRRVTIEDEDGSHYVLADSYDGKRLNSPNDVVARSDGSVYFTDPTFGLREHKKWKEQDCCGVYRVSPDGEITRVVDNFQLPNGLAFTPDESVLYINDTAAAHIRAFDVAPDGSLSNGRVFIDMHGDEPGAPDGMKVDTQGNVYCTGPGGFWIMNPEGKCLARVMPPELPSNMAFGDADWQTLYMTARSSVYRMRINVPGVPVGVMNPISHWPPPSQ
ncbi:MAG: SMP-30/gluconolactonase/LRE family protein [Dehalococcoidales bacterium]|nr:SMP-30/gluconolactonase/LRE family protein [Dehalococcoidales bacterium]